MAEQKKDTIKVENGRLIIDVALQAPVVSKSGKSEVVYSTHGSVSVEGGYSIGINLYRPR